MSSPDLTGKTTTLISVASAKSKANLSLDIVLVCTMLPSYIHKSEDAAHTHHVALQFLLNKVSEFWKVS